VYPIIEKYSWLSKDMTVNDAPGDKVIIRGPALFSVEKYFKQGVSQNLRKYIQDEVIRSARTLKGAEIDVNHEISVWEETRKGSKPHGKGHVLYGEEENGVVEYVAEVNDKVYAGKVRDTDKVRRGVITEKDYFEKWGKKPLLGVSVDAEFLHLRCIKCGQKFYSGKEYEKHMADVELVKNFEYEPHGIVFRRLSLVEPPEQPGVIGASFEVLETKQAGYEQLLETITKVHEEQTMSNIGIRKEGHVAVGKTGIIPEEKEAKPKQETKEAKVEEQKKPTAKEEVIAQPISPLLKEVKLAKFKLDESVPKMSLGEPFAGYTDFADCVAKNSDKDNPEAYCGSIKHQVEGETYFRTKVAEYFNNITETFPQIASNLTTIYEDLCIRIDGLPKDDVSWKEQFSTVTATLDAKLGEIRTIIESIPKDDLAWKELKIPDLIPLTKRLDELKIPDLKPLESKLEETTKTIIGLVTTLEKKVAEIKIPDLAPLQKKLDETAKTIPDLAPLVKRFDELKIPDLAPLQKRLDELKIPDIAPLEKKLAELKIPDIAPLEKKLSEIKMPDLEPLNKEILALKETIKTLEKNSEDKTKKIDEKVEAGLKEFKTILDISDKNYVGLEKSFEDYRKVAETRAKEREDNKVKETTDVNAKLDALKTDTDNLKDKLKPQFKGQAKEQTAKKDVGTSNWHP